MLLFFLPCFFYFLSLTEASAFDLIFEISPESAFNPSISIKKDVMNIQNTYCHTASLVASIHEYSEGYMFIRHDKYPPLWKTSGCSTVSTQKVCLSYINLNTNELKNELNHIKENTMARPSQTIILSNEEKEQLLEILESSKEGSNIYKRVSTILKLSLGIKPCEIAKTLGISESRCSEYKQRYLKNGIEGLYDAPHTPFSPSLETVLQSMWNEHGNAWGVKDYANALHCSISSIKGYMKNLGIDGQVICDDKDVGISTTHNRVQKGDGPKLRITVEIFDEEDNCVKKVTREENLDSLNQLNNSTNFNDFSKAINDMERTYFQTMTNATIDSYNEALIYKKKEDRNRQVKVVSRLGNFIVYAPSWINQHLAPNESYITTDLKKLIIETVTNTSYNKGCAILNNALARKEDEKLKTTTIEHLISREGNILRNSQLEFAQGIIKEINSEVPIPERRDLSLNSQSKTKKDKSEKNNKSSKSDNKTTEKQKETLGNSENSCNANKDQSSLLNNYQANYNQESADNFEQNELILKGIEFIKNHNKNNTDILLSFNLINQIELDLNKTTYLHLDEVCVTHQNDKRHVNGNDAFKISERIYHSNAYIKTSQDKYSITADDIQSAAFISYAYLLKNNLVDDHKLVFFTDGAKSIRNAINDYFIPLKGSYFHTWLDWYHAKKKTNERLSLALINGGKNRKETEEIKKENARTKAAVLHHIWYGDVDGAIQIIRDLPDNRVKDRARAEQLISYFNERRDNICCYALRRALGLPNSSNPVETLNSTLVANRQKGKGVSWGHRGSYALATFQALIENNELDRWLNENFVFLTPCTLNTEKHSAPNKGKAKAA